MNHLEELAELYALGSLAPAEQSRVEAHIAGCETCRQRVSDAEQVVLALAEAEPQVEVQRRDFRKSNSTNTWRFLAGVAAGLILPLLILLPPAMRARQGEQQTEVALSALVNSHFNHVAFTRETSDAPAAKLLYARTGQWLYVIVVQPRSDLTVLVRGSQGVRTVGTTRSNRTESALFIAHPGTVSEVVLAKDGTTIASARPLIAMPQPQPGK